MNHLNNRINQTLETINKHAKQERVVCITYKHSRTRKGVQILNKSKSAAWPGDDVTTNTTTREKDGGAAQNIARVEMALGIYSSSLINANELLYAHADLKESVWWKCFERY